MAVEDGVDGADGGTRDRRIPAPQTLADLRRGPARILPLELDDQLLDLHRELIGMPIRPPGIVNLLRVARSCPVTSTPPIVLSRRTSLHPIQRTRDCGADGGEPIAGGVDRLETDSARYREPTRTVGAERLT